MEFLFELLADLLIEGGIEASSNPKVSKWIRYPILIILILFFASVIFGIIFLGIHLLKENTIGALLIILVGLIMLIGSIIKFTKIYIKDKNIHYDD